MDPTLIIFAALAGFICYRLYTVLGTRGGHEPDEQEEPPYARKAEEAAHYEEPETAPETPRSKQPDWAGQIIEVYPAFDAKEFLTGAKAAYEMIVDAFAGDNLRDVKPYIDPGVYRAFEAAVKARREAGQISDLNFVGIEDASVEKAVVDNGTMRITVDFISNQIRVLRNEAGEVIDGDPGNIDLVRDRWTFARPVSSKDPNWILIATGGSAPDAS